MGLGVASLRHFHWMIGLKKACKVRRSNGLTGRRGFCKFLQIIAVAVASRLRKEGAMSAWTPWRRTLLAVMALTLLGMGALASAAYAAPDAYRLREPQDEVIYFVLPDRFENGDATNDHGGPEGRSAGRRLRPDAGRASIMAAT
jgi:hypothetical protein